MGQSVHDSNRVPTLIAASNADGVTPVTLYADPTTHRLLTSGASSGTVTSVSVVTANGVSGSVANATTTPAITLTLGAITPTSVNGNIFTTGSSTYTGTAGQTYTFPTTSATIARTDAANTFTGASTASAWVLTSPTITTKISPTTDDGAPLGDTTHNFSDLFLASGAVINYANSNVVLTHTSGVLTLGTGNLIISTAGTASGSVATIDGTQTLTNKTLTAPIIGGAASLADAATVSLIVPTADGTATGIVTSAFNSGYSSTAIGDLMYLDSSATWQKTDANTLALYNGMLGIALSVAASGAAVKVALPGSIVYATAFPTFTIGSPVYMSETAGAVTGTQPTTADAAIRVIGWGVHADKLFFMPSSDYVTHT